MDKSKKNAEKARILDEMAEVMEARGYVHMCNADGIRCILDAIDVAQSRLSKKERDIFGHDDLDQPGIGR